VVSRWTVFLATLAASFFGLLALASAQDASSCRTPRQATDSVFHWQQPGRDRLDEASRCLELPGRSRADKHIVARKLKRLYDERLALIDMAAISDDPDYRDRAGVERVVPHASLPGIVVERRADGQWHWTEASLRTVVQMVGESDNSLGKWIATRVPDWLTGVTFGLALWQYLALLATVVIGLIARRIVYFVVLSRVQKTTDKLGQKWISRFIDVVAAPGSTLVVALLLRVTYPELDLPIRAAMALSVAVRLLVVASVVWAAYRFVDVVAERMAERASETDTKLDDQLVPLVRKSLKVCTVVIGTLVGLQNLNVDVGSLLAGLGIGGLAFALAAKDTLSNFFGSLMIFVDRPFQIGDWISAAGVEGIVEEVGFRSTRVRTFYNSLVTVPNSKLMDANIDNYGERQFRRTSITLSLAYETTPEQMQAFCDGVRAIIQANPATRKDYYEVHMSGFGASSLDVMLYFFFKVDSWSEELRQRHNVFLEIMRLARDLKVDFAYPTQTLHHTFDHVPTEARPARVTPSDEELAALVRGFGPKGERARPEGPTITSGFFAVATEGSSDDVSEDAGG
jgi:MscS family membrane protein